MAGDVLAVDFFDLAAEFLQAFAQRLQNLVHAVPVGLGEALAFVFQYVVGQAAELIRQGLAGILQQCQFFGVAFAFGFKLGLHADQAFAQRGRQRVALLQFKLQVADFCAQAALLVQAFLQRGVFAAQRFHGRTPVFRLFGLVFQALVQVDDLCFAGFQAGLQGKHFRLQALAGAFDGGALADAQQQRGSGKSGQRGEHKPKGGEIIQGGWHGAGGGNETTETKQRKQTLASCHCPMAPRDRLRCRPLFRLQHGRWLPGQCLVINTGVWRPRGCAGRGRRWDGVAASGVPRKPWNRCGTKTHGHRPTCRKPI